jgi:hypothetical protein
MEQIIVASYVASRLDIFMIFILQKLHSVLKRKPSKSECRFFEPNPLDPGFRLHHFSCKWQEAVITPSKMHHCPL